MEQTTSTNRDAYATAVCVLLAATALRWALVAAASYPAPFTGVASSGPFVIALCVLQRCAATRDMLAFAAAARTGLLFLLLVAYLPESNEAIMHLARAVPYVDGALGRADQALGFDWLAYVGWLDKHPLLWDACSIAYLSIWPQVVCVGIVLGLRKTGERACAFFTAQALTLSATCLCAALFPALGAFVHWDGAHALMRRAGDLAVADHMTETLEWVRTSQWTAPRFQAFHAVVSFPSYHAACCALLVWATWENRWVRLPSCALNLAMLAATPAQGSHYLVDILGGLAVAAAAIVAAKALTRSLFVRAFSTRLGKTFAQVPGLARSRPGAGGSDVLENREGQLVRERPVGRRADRTRSARRAAILFGASIERRLHMSRKAATSGTAEARPQGACHASARRSPVR